MIHPADVPSHVRSSVIVVNLRHINGGVKLYVCSDCPKHCCTATELR